MTNSSCLSDLRSAIPRAYWPQVISALRHNHLIWNALQNQEFRKLVISTLGSDHQKWTPAQIAYLALKKDHAFSEICMQPLAEIDPELRVHAIQTYEAHVNATPPKMDLPAAGLLMLALLEHFRLSQSWENIPQDDHWEAPYSCLFGCIKQPSMLLRSLPTSISTEILLANPLTPELQLQYFTGILAAVSTSQRLTILRKLASQQPKLSQQLAQQLWKSQSSSETRLISNDQRANLLNRFEQIQFLANHIRDELSLAEGYINATSDPLANLTLQSVLKQSHNLSNQIQTQITQITILTDGSQETLENLEFAQALPPIPDEDIAESAVLLTEKGEIDQAQTLLSQTKNDQHPMIDLAKIGIALKQGQRNNARRWAQEVYPRFDLREPYLVLIFAKYLLKLNMGMEAAQLLEGLLQTHPNHVEASQIAALSFVSVGDYAKASQAIHLATSLAPERIDLLRESAQIQEYLGQWPAALETRQTIAENQIEPKISDLRALAQCALWAGQSHQAQETCIIALETYPDDGPIHAILGISLFQKGRKEKAQEHLQLAVQVSPEEPLPWLILAQTQLEQEGLMAARESLKKAVLASPEQAEIHLALGENYLQDGFISQALPCLQKANQLASDISDIKNSYLRSQIALPLAKAYFELGRANEALEILQVNPPQPAKQAEQLHLRAQSLLFLGRANEAIPLLAKAQLTNPQDVSIGLDYARAILASGKDHQRAIESLDSLLANNPQNPEALALLAEALRVSGKTKEALDIYRQALTTHLSDDTHWYAQLSIGLAKCALALNQPETALAALQQAWQNNPQNLEVLQTLTESYAAANLTEQAYQTAFMARDLAPLSLENLTWFSNLMIRIKAYDEAAHALNCAIELAPLQADLYLALGKIHQLVGDFKSAYQAYLTLTELDQASPEELSQAATQLKVLNKPEDAVICLKIAVRRCQNPQSKDTCAQLLDNLIDAYLQLQQPSEALQVLDEFMGYQPDSLRLFGRRIMLLQQLGRAAEAQSDLRNALQENPENPVIHQTAMQLFYVQGDLVQAVYHAQKAIENLSAQDNELLFSILKTTADLYDACLDSSEAYEVLRHPFLIGQSSNDIDFYCLSAELALSIEDEIDAARALTEALKIEPAHPRVLALQARLTARHGDSKSAQLTLQNALTAWGNIPSHEILSPVSILAIAEAAKELQEWSTAIFLLQTAVESFPQEPRVHLRLARGLVLRAEYQRLCEALFITKHAPGASSITDFSHQNFEQAVLKAAQTSEEKTSKNIQTEIAHWQLRGQAVFQPSVEHARALAEIPQTSDSRAALLAALRHSREHSEKPAALSSFAKASYRLMQEQDVGLNLMIQLALALSIRNPNQAQEAVQKALSIGVRQRHPSLPILYAVKAHVANQASNPAEIVKALETGLSLWPDEAGWHSWLGDALQETSEPDNQKIIDHYKKAMELEPKNGQHHLKLGQFQLQQKDYQSAISNLQHATQLIPNDAASWLALAQANRLIGEYSQTFQNAERAIQLEPKHIDVHLLLIETALEILNPKKALQYCQVAEKISPKNPDILLLKTRALDGMGNADDALQTFNQALKYVPKTIPLMLEYAQVTQRAKGLQPAINAIRDLAEEYPEDPRVLALMAEMLVESEQSDPAVEIAQKALNTNQGDLDCIQESDLLKMLGRLMRRNGQLDHAIQYLTDAIQCNTDNYEAYIELGRTYQERRQYAQAIDAYHQAIAITPGDSQAYYFAGQAFKAIKDYGAAEEMLRRAAKLAPEDLAIRRQLGGLVALNLVHNPKEGADLYVD